MALTSEDVIALARMARFEVSPEDIDRFRVQLNVVLERIAELEQVAVPDDPVADRVAVRLRDDVANDSALLRGVEALSGDVIAGFFTVPQALPSDGATQ